MKAKWNPLFTPYYTPLEMLEMGVFEGKYINNIQGLPKSWYKVKKVLGKNDKPDPSVNYYGVKSRQPLSLWKKEGWIKTDKNGWFEWYCKYYLGRRLGEEDDWQIARWNSFVARHAAQVNKHCATGDKECRPRQRQGLLQWAWNSDIEPTKENKEAALKRITGKLNISLEGQQMFGFFKEF